MALTTLWQAEELRNVLLSEIIAISRAGSFRFLPVLLWNAQARLLYSRTTSSGAPWKGSNPPTKIWAKRRRPWVPWLSSLQDWKNYYMLHSNTASEPSQHLFSPINQKHTYWNRRSTRFAISSHRVARVVQTVCWFVRVMRSLKNLSGTK